MEHPTLPAIQQACEQLRSRIVATPCLPLTSDRIRPHLPEGAEVVMKMEMFQQAGSFKARGVLLAIDGLSEAERKAGVTAVSAGNHALAVSWSAHRAGLSAKVVMPKTADNIRVDGCRALGADVILAEDVGEAFKEVARLVEEEGRTMLHPFDSYNMALGSATCGYEFASAYPEIDTYVLPIGGGGLIAGMSAAIKLISPRAEIIGVEPFGADSMWQSFEKGEAVHLDGVNTIADSLGAPMALKDTYELARKNVSEIIRIEDNIMRETMTYLYDALKIIAEPACAASTAAVIGPLKERLKGKKVGVIACGSNISLAKFERIVKGE